MKNVYIRKIQKKDLNKKNLSKWVIWLNDKKVNEYSNQRFKKHNIKSQKIFLKEKLQDKKSIIFKIIYDKEFIGVIEIGNIDKNNSNCEIMYFIGEKKFWSKGIGFNSINLAIIYIKKKLKIKKIYAGCSLENKASLKILKKNNFEIEGRIKNYLVSSKNNKFRTDKIILGINT